mgnify:CR=1 FL=1
MTKKSKVKEFLAKKLKIQAEIQFKNEATKLTSARSKIGAGKKLKFS